MKRRVILEVSVALACVMVCLAVWLFASKLAAPEPIAERESETEPEPEYTHFVILDPGHGGEYPGCIRGGVEEKALTLEICTRIRDKLRESAVDALMTRETDVTVTLDERCEIANASEAELFVSVHANSYPEEAIAGLESYFYKGSESGKALSDSVLAHAESAGIRTRYSREGNYQVIRDTKVPAILVETGYMTNPAELELLMSADYQDKLAEAIAGAIVEYLGSAE